MRYTLILLLLFTGSINAQKTTLVVGGTLRDCPELILRYAHRIEGIRVFEIPSNRLIYEAKTSDSTEIPRLIELKNVNTSNYRISYSTNRSPYQDKYIALKPISVNYVNFCRYDKNVEPINIFNGATIGDTILIENNTTGCFTHDYSKTFLIQTTTGWTIQQHQYRVDCRLESISGKLEVSKKPTQISKSKIVKNEDIIKINLAINKIRMLTSGGCTTNSIYTIRYKNISLKLNDGSCENLLNEIVYKYTGSYY
jgi:hypothetical protein